MVCLIQFGVIFLLFSTLSMHRLLSRRMTQCYCHRKYLCTPVTDTCYTCHLQMPVTHVYTFNLHMSLIPTIYTCHLHLPLTPVTPITAATYKYYLHVCTHVTYACQLHLFTPLICAYHLCLPVIYTYFTRHLYIQFTPAT